MPEILSTDQTLAVVKGELTKRKNRILQMIPTGQPIDYGRFMQQAMLLCERTPNLLECTPMSLAGSIMDSAKAGMSLDPVLGQGYIVPFKDSRAGITRATFMPGYRGLMLMAYRSKYVTSMWANVIRRGDHHAETLGTNQGIEHTRPPLEDQDADYHAKQAIIGVYACAKLATGDILTTPVMPLHMIETIRKRSPSGNSPAWQDHYEEMAKKTALRRLCKTLPLSPDDLRVALQDEALDAGIPPEPTEIEYEEMEKGGGAPAPEATATVEPPPPAKPGKTMLKKQLQRLQGAVDHEECEPEDVNAWYATKGFGGLEWGDLPRAAADELLKEVEAGTLKGLAERLPPPAKLDIDDAPPDTGGADWTDESWKDGRN